VGVRLTLWPPGPAPPSGGGGGGGGGLAPPLFGRLQWCPRLFWLLRGHFGVFAMKSSAGGHDSYAFSRSFGANIRNNKWRFPSVVPLAGRNKKCVSPFWGSIHSGY
jgi:hypothetical protein